MSTEERAVPSPTYNPNVPRFKLTIEYAGTRYSGWQIQQNAKTVQGEIDRAVRTLTGRKDFELYGSGRTDAGVHALGQVAHLDVSTPLPPEKLRRGLNDDLPSDINIVSAAIVPHRFHARHDAVARRYLYQVSTRRTAFAKPHVWWVKEALNVDRMRSAARAFEGKHDFATFAAVDRDNSEKSTIVLLERIDVIEEGALLLFVIEGSHFLWKMVRRLIGILVEVGKDEMDVTAAAALLHKRSPLPAKLTAPGSGLFLERVFYDGDDRSEAIRSLGHWITW